MHFISLVIKRGSNHRAKALKGHSLYSRKIKFAATSALRGWLRYVFYQCDFFKDKSSPLNDKTHYFMKFKRNFPENFEKYGNFKISNVCVLPKRFLSFFLWICRYLFYINIPSFIKICLELWEIWHFQNFKWAWYALYLTDSTHLQKEPVFCHNTSSCQISSKSVKNFLR